VNILSESFSVSVRFSVEKADVGIQPGNTPFRAMFVCTADVVARRTHLAFVALEQQMFAAVTVRQRQECLTNLQPRHTSSG